jgi:hypothetical protein
MKVKDNWDINTSIHSRNRLSINAKARLSPPSPLWGEGGDKGKYKKISRQIPVLNESKSTVEAAELLNPLNYKDSSAKGRNLNFIVRYINREKLVVNELGSFYFVKTVIQYYRYGE